jgi:hypothetical protein
MREVYIGKTITIDNKQFKAEEFYVVDNSFALAIISSGCGCYASDDDFLQLEGETNERNFNT